MKQKGLSDYYRRRWTDRIESAGGAVKEWTKTVAGLGTALVSHKTGPLTYLHEEGHEIAVRLLYKNPHTSVHVDGIDNFNSFCEKPSWRTFLDWLTGVDAGDDGAAGYCSWWGDEPSGFGEILGPKKSDAFICAAGSMAEEALALLLLFSAYKRGRRGKDPVFPLFASTVYHAAPCAYAWSARFPELISTDPEVLERVLPGHDWVNFAEATGINPAVTAGVITAIYPLAALGLYLKARHDRKKREKKSYLDTLVRCGKIDESQLDAALDSYSRRRKLLKAENDVAKMPDALDAREKTKRLEKLLQEYSKSTDYFGKAFNKEIEEVDDWWKAEGKEVEKQDVYEISKVFGVWDLKKSRKIYDKIYRKMCGKMFMRYSGFPEDEGKQLKYAKWFCKEFNVIPKDEKYSDVIPALRNVCGCEDIFDSLGGLNVRKYRPKERYEVSVSDVLDMKDVMLRAESEGTYDFIYQSVKSLNKSHGGNYGAVVGELAIYNKSPAAQLVA